MTAKKKWVAVTLAVSLGCGAAFGQIEKGEYAPDIESKTWILNYGDRPSLIETRGMITILYFWSPVTGKFGEDFLNQLVMVQNLYGMGGALFVIGVTSGTRDQVEDMVDNSMAFFPVACEAQKIFDEYDIPKEIPHGVVIDPDGKVAWAGPVWELGQGGFQAVNEIFEKNPPFRTNPREAARADRHISTARQAVLESDYQKAYLETREAFAAARQGDPLQTRAEDVMEVIDAEARLRLREVDSLIDAEDWQDAVAKTRSVKNEFRGMPIAREAREREERYAEDHDGYKAVLDEYKKEDTAAELLLRAVSDVRSRRFGPAFKKLEMILRDFDGTEGAEYAKPIKKRMEDNPAVMAEVRNAKASADAGQWIAQARNFISRGRYDEARSLLRDVIREYPKTSYEDEAIKLLIEIPDE
ncbi:MAG: redoxin domain-containing protein [Phycisphaerales bacterium]|nr:redoxin domain-containing protein [Phycisphaerales bacterium]